MERPSYTEQLLLQLNQQRSKGHWCDVIIVVENVLFRAHKNVLAACSSYFKCLVLHDNLITLNAAVVNPLVFKQVLDFIYTGQLSTSHHASDQGVSDLLRAASYLQLSDLAALCRRKLCKSSDWTSSTIKGHLHPGSMEVQQSHNQMLHREDLSEEELFQAQRVSVNSSAAVGLNGSVETGLRIKLTRKSPTGSLQQNSQQTAAHKRPRSSSCLEGRVQTKRQEVDNGELEDQAEVREGDLVLKDELRESVSEEEEVKPASYIYHQPQPAVQPALYDTYMCIPCGRGFPSSEQLITHVASHTTEELRKKAEDTEEHQDTKEPKADVTRPRHACSVCSRSYADVALLTQHERSHWPTRPFSCDVCGKLFTQRGTMTRHMRSHLGLKPFACEECGMRFTRQYRKMEHMRIHTGEKPYECQLCGVKFTQQRSIISHLKIHTVVSV
uniref:Hypermethylated in cancer 2 n=1 Tax=Dicentrarchus labrax TaxID=13489 RepID=A0A8C4EMX3_DICLA